MAQDAAQSGLSDLPGGPAIVLHLHDGIGGIHDAEIGHRVHLYRHIVFGYRLLRRDVQCHHPQVNLHHAVDDGDDEEQARPLGSHQPTQPEDHPALVLLHDLDRRGQDAYEYDDDY